MMKPYVQEQNGILYLPHRACDQCRSRKIRCDRQLPCCNCRLAKKQCSFTNAGPKTRQLRTRLGRLGEKKSDSIEDRLGRIEETLLALTRSKCRHNCSDSSPVHDDVVPTSMGDQSANIEFLSPPGNVTNRDWKSGSRNGRGGSSIQAQMNFACRYLQNIIDLNNAPEEENDTLRKALVSLQRLTQNTVTEEDSSVDTVASSLASTVALKEPAIQLPHAKPMAENGLRGLPMPPLAEVFDLLQDLYKTRTVTFPMVCVFTSADLLTEHCRRLYLPTREQEAPYATFLTVNAGLFFLFKEKMALAVHRGDQEAVVRYLALRNTCRDNIETALAHMPLVLPACYDSLLALILGTGYGIEMSRPWLAWRLNTAACQMCIELGYHQEEEEEDQNTDPPNRDARRILFWFAYIHDRVLSLRFGRACFMQDFDITVPRTLEPFSPEFEGHRTIISSWIVLGEVQGRIYRELYSPAAQRCTVSQRVRSARECTDILQHELYAVQQQRARLEQRLFTWSDMDEADDHDGNVGDNDKAAMEIEAMLLRVDEVTILSSLTLAYRAIPPEEGDENNETDETDACEGIEKCNNDSVGRPPAKSTLFCDECILMARKAIHMHLEYLQRADRNPMLVATHMHWTILLLPFAPFIVLFCCIMERANVEDLCYLQRCMESLQPWQKISVQAGQLFRMCQSLFEAAQVHVKCEPHVDVA